MTTIIHTTGTNLFEVHVQKFNAGTSIYTPNPDMKYCVVEMTAGGGGGASCSTTVLIAASGGGAAYARKLFTNIDIGTGQQVIVGTKGLAGLIATDGGTSSLGTILHCNAGTSANGLIGGLGGAAGTLGDLEIGGEDAKNASGQFAYVPGMAVVNIPKGGNSHLGFGGEAELVFNSAESITLVHNGNLPKGYGSGGGGSFGENALGADGKDGIVIITEYCWTAPTNTLDGTAITDFCFDSVVCPV